MKNCKKKVNPVRSLRKVLNPTFATPVYLFLRQATRHSASNGVKITILAPLLILIGTVFFNATPVHALSIVIHVPEKYTDVEAGERFYFELEIKYPENPSRKDLRLNYEIKKDDEIIAQSKVLKAVETQASFMDYIVVPESAKSGLHIINIVISDYEFLREEVSASFHVVGNKGAQMKMYFFVILGAIAFVGLLVMFQIFVFRRRK